MLALGGHNFLKNFTLTWGRFVIMLLTFALLISQNILSLLLPYQNSLKTHINEMLDLDLIKQQADHGILDISKLAQSIVGFLSKMCAPARDEQAKKILLNEDIVDLFR